MKSIAIIPARMGSSRFPGKPMKEIHGIPMIGHCYYRTSMCKDLIATYVATCDQEIFDYIKSINGNVVMTSSSHEMASDRASEAMTIIEEEINSMVDIVVMVQGDEPMLTPEMISESLKPFKSDPKVNVVNLMASIETIEEFEDPNEVKVVVDNFNNAIYFSREAIPSKKKFFSEISMFKQVCVIPFKRESLLKFNEMQRTNLEVIESIDMLRLLENGEKVRMVMCDTLSYSVDTPEDLIKTQKAMENDPLINLYK